MRIPIQIKIFIKILTLTFGLNFVWEISQMFLYKDHSDGWMDFVFVHIKASLGDVILFGIIYLLGVLIFQGKTWFLQKRAAIYAFTIICGFAIAVIVEKYALATGRWEYASFMPIIPILKVGFSPVLQLTILPPLIILFAQKIWEDKIKE